MRTVSGQLPRNEWEWLALAQHHGLATRLLDWSVNPLIALWFAIERPAAEAKPAVVWAFTTESSDFADPKKNPFEIGRTKIFRPPHIVARIKAQSGYFTVHALQKSGKFIRLENNKQYKGRLKKLVIPPEKFSQIRYTLDYLGINRAFVYSDLDGLARHIVWQNSKIEDESAPLVDIPPILT